MRFNSANYRQSPVRRFFFGALIGVAISTPIFLAIDDLPVSILFMALFGVIVGVGQILGGSSSPRSRRALPWLNGLGAVTFAIGVGVFFAVR